MSEINENQKAVSEAYKANYDAVDWSKSSGAPIEVIETSCGEVRRYEEKADNTPLHGIQNIREDKPHYSNNGAIHRDQVDSFNKQCVRGTHYEKGSGKLVSTSKYAREREARRRGLSFN